MPARLERRDDLLIHADDVDLLHRIGLDSFDALMAIPGEQRLDKRGLPPWRERIVLEREGRTLFLKRYRQPPWREQLRRVLRGAGSTAQTEWRWLTELARLGIPGPHPVAFGQRRRAGVEQASLVLTAAVAGESLERRAARGRTGPLADAATRSRIGRELGRLVAALHGAGLVHRDLYLSHVFLDLSDGGVRLSLIDLQRVLRPRWRWRRWIVKDLAALDYSTPAALASRTERLRWYARHYRGVTRLAAADRRIIRSVAAKARRIARHTVKHGL